MNRKEWMRQEIAAWRMEGVVDEKTANVLTERYLETGPRFSWGAMVASGFGAFMIGLGVIALFAANWDALGRGARAAVAIAPVVLCGLAAFVAARRNWQSRLFWEPLGIAWFVLTGAATCLVAQTYQIGGSVPQLILLMGALTLPVVWVTRAVVPMGLWPVLAIVWAFNHHGFSNAVAWGGVAFMACSLPGYVAFVRGKPGKAAFVVGQLLTGLVYSFGLALMLVRTFSVFHLWNGVLTFWGCCALVGMAAVVFKLPVWSFVATVVAVCAAVPCPFEHASGLYVLALCLAAGIVAWGVAKVRLARTNLGAVLLFWLILAKFFESRVDFTVKGVVLIFAGLLLTGLNIAFIRYKKARS